MSTLVNTRQTSKESFVQRYPLFTFFVLAIGLTWVFMITDALGSHGILPFRLPIPLMVVMGYMPTLAAVLVTNGIEGREGVGALMRKLFIVRIGLRWYLFAIFGMAGIYALSIGVYNILHAGSHLPLFSEQLPQGSAWQVALMIVPMFIAIGIVNGEEFAWRGFAIPRLQARYNALTASIIMGLLWSLFHLPLFFTVTGSSQAGMNFWSFTINTLSLSILYTWMLNNTRGSVLLAYLLHAAANTWSQVFSIDHSHGGDYLPWILPALAVIVIVTNGAENLSRNNTRIKEDRST